MTKLNIYEKLGAFYLGRTFDPARGEATDELLLYDAKDLTTHAVCVGMTGSGKTGLGVTLLEEAAIDGIPALIVDPKGDMGNLMLNFPKLRPADFAPWVDPGEARRKGMEPDEYAADRAALWKKGLAEWGQDGERIQRLRDAAEVAIYTPGGTAGLPLTVLRSFDAPPAAIIDDAEALNDRVSGAVTGLLALLAVDADPVRSREHILLANIIEGAWREGRNLDLGRLIQLVQAPPFERIGVMDVDSFFPPGDRFALAMLINNLLASPGFAAWTTGAPLDIQKLLYTADGRPRLAVLSLAHLDERERMFFVTILLNEVITWMRTQSGTSSLRALLYMDEIFGYFPPTANPPAKRPMLTLLKQARAYGLGVVLCTQNPVDLDYKGLSNTGTWFIGRLQTERDKLRVLDGLEGASASSGAMFDRAAMDRLLSGLGSRVFLLNNVHENGPVLFNTRWALSYLRGPLTREHIKTLMAGVAAAPAPVPVAARKVDAVEPAVAAAPAPEPSGPPSLPPTVEQTFLAATRAVPGGASLVYRPALLARVRLHYVRASANVDEWKEVALLADDFQERDPWGDALELPDGQVAMDATPDAGGHFDAVPGPAARATQYRTWTTSLKAHLYRERPLTLYKAKSLKEWSQPGEDEGDFRVRLRGALHEKRDLEMEKLRKRYESKLDTLQDRLRRAEDKVEREEAQFKHSGLSTALTLGATVLGAMFGRKTMSVGTVGRAASTVRGASRTAKEKGDIGRAKEGAEALREKIAEMEEELERELEEIREETDVDGLELDAVVVAPRKSDLQVETLALAWVPHYRDGRDLVPVADLD